MPSTSNVVASSGGDEIAMSFSWRMRFTRSIAFLALAAGSTVKTWSYLFLKYRASFARSPASASATGEDSSPTVETSLKSTAYDMGRTLSLTVRGSVRWVRNGNEDNEHRRPRLAADAGMGRD